MASRVGVLVRVCVCLCECVGSGCLKKQWKNTSIVPLQFMRPHGMAQWWRAKTVETAVKTHLYPVLGADKDVEPSPCSGLYLLLSLSYILASDTATAYAVIYIYIF